MKHLNTCTVTMKKLISSCDKTLIMIIVVLSILSLYCLSPIILGFVAESVPDDKAGYSFYQFF